MLGWLLDSHVHKAASSQYSGYPASRSGFALCASRNTHLEIQNLFSRLGITAGLTSHEKGLVPTGSGREVAFVDGA
jgi:hypothetical protein